MTNQIQARAMNEPGVEIKVWLSKFVGVWSNVNALSADSADHLEAVMPTSQPAAFHCVSAWHLLTSAIGHAPWS